MYITCPSCKANFVVSPEQLGPQGRNVKCSKCNNVWHALADISKAKIEPIITATENTHTNAHEPGINLPALLPIRLPAYLCVTPVLLIALVVFLSVAFFSDTIGAIGNNEAFAGVSLKDVRVEHRKEAAKVIVGYKVINSSDHVVAMPNVRIRLFDTDGRVMQTHVENTVVSLQPKQYVTIKTEFTSVPPSAKSIDVVIGNTLDFLFR